MRLSLITAMFSVATLAAASPYGYLHRHPEHGPAAPDMSHARNPKEIGVHPSHRLHGRGADEDEAGNEIPDSEMAWFPYAVKWANTRAILWQTWPKLGFSEKQQIYDNGLHTFLSRGAEMLTDKGFVTSIRDHSDLDIEGIFEDYNTIVGDVAIFDFVERDTLNYFNDRFQEELDLQQALVQSSDPTGSSEQPAWDFN